MLSLKAAVPLAALTLAAVAGAAPAHADHEDDVRAVANVVAMFAYPVNEIVAKGTAGVVYKHVGDEAAGGEAHDAGSPHDGAQPGQVAAHLVGGQRGICNAAPCNRTRWVLPLIARQGQSHFPLEPPHGIG